MLTSSKVESAQALGDTALQGSTWHTDEIQELSILPLTPLAGSVMFNNAGIPARSALLKNDLSTSTGLA